MSEVKGREGSVHPVRSSRLPGADSLLDVSGLATPLYGGRYELLALLGVGASGSVYRVRDVELDELLALKVLRKELVGDPQTIALFRNEVRLARRVTSRNVARVYDIGEHDGEKYLTMELIEGESLTHRLASTVDGLRRPLPLQEIADLTDQVCAGLTAAHHSGVVHCGPVQSANCPQRLGFFVARNRVGTGECRCDTQRLMRLNSLSPTRDV